MDAVLEQARNQVSSWTRQRHQLLEANSEALETGRVTAKALYDTAKATEQELDLDQKTTLQELVIEDFDHEQVWAGLELQNQARLSLWQSQVNKLLHTDLDKFQLLKGNAEASIFASSNRKRKIQDDLDEDEDDALDEITIDKKKKGLELLDQSDADNEDDEDQDEDENLDHLDQSDDDDNDLESGDDEADDDDHEGEEESEDDNRDEEEDPILKDPDFQHMSDSDLDDLPLFENIHTDEDDTNEEEEEDEEDKAKKADVDTKADQYMENAMKSLKTRSSQVDDRFFKMSEMEKFLDAEDQNEDLRRRREEQRGANDQDDDVTAIDYFDDLDDDEDDDEKVTYEQYFGSSQQQQQRSKTKETRDEAGPTPDERLKTNILSSDDGDSENEAGTDIGEVKSTFEERQMRLKKKIQAMENEALGNKPWQLQGEIAGPARPENSLLQEHLDYDNMARAAPIITEAVSKRLEDIILQRVKDRAWDDVVRKVKPVENPYDYKKRLVLDQEKSKLSLAEIYEREFLDKQQAAEDAQKVDSLLDRESVENPQEVDAIREDMRKLFVKLDTLTHFHYTPKNVNAEVKIVKNMPAVAVEDVAPITATDATLLAPQEIMDTKRGQSLGSAERGETDRKRARRKKKLHQKKKFARQKESSTKIASSKPSK